MSEQMNSLLEDRVALVTGAAAGIGAAIVGALAAAGARGGALDLNEPSSVNTPANWLPLRGDVRDAGALRSAVASICSRFGQIDIVVANAGVVPPWTSTVTIDVEEWEQVFAINTRGVMLTLREAARAMAGRGGSLVAVSSLNGWRGNPRLPAYAASKHAVVGLVRSAALDLGEQNIRVNAVAPGPIATEALLARMDARSRKGGPSVSTALAEAAASTALRRLASVQDVANAVLFLASDLASGITGQLLAVDGGVL